MHILLTLLGKETRALFSSSIAYVVITVFLLLMGYAFTAFLFLNTRQPPFNSLQARQAINYAIDRGRLIRLLHLSSPDQATPTCQSLRYRKSTIAVSYKSCPFLQA